MYHNSMLPSMALFFFFVATFIAPSVAEDVKLSKGYYTWFTARENKECEMMSSVFPRGYDFLNLNTNVSATLNTEFSSMAWIGTRLQIEDKQWIQAFQHNQKCYESTVDVISTYALSAQGDSVLKCYNNCNKTNFALNSEMCKCIDEDTAELRDLCEFKACPGGVNNNCGSSVSCNCHYHVTRKAHETEVLSPETSVSSADVENSGAQCFVCAQESRVICHELKSKDINIDCGNSSVNFYIKSFQFSNVEKTKYWIGYIKIDEYGRWNIGHSDLCIAVNVSSDSQENQYMATSCSDELPVLCLAQCASCVESFVYYIVGGVIGFLLILVLICMLIFVKRRRCKRRDKQENARLSQCCIRHNDLQVHQAREQENIAMNGNNVYNVLHENNKLNDVDLGQYDQSYVKDKDVYDHLNEQNSEHQHVVGESYDTMASVMATTDTSHRPVTHNQTQSTLIQTYEDIELKS